MKVQRLPQTAYDTNTRWCVSEPARRLSITATIASKPTQSIGYSWSLPPLFLNGDEHRFRHYYSLWLGRVGVAVVWKWRSIVKVGKAG